MITFTKRFIEWFARYGITKTDRYRLSQDRIQTSHEAVFQEIAWRAYRRGRKDGQKETKKVYKLLMERWNLAETNSREGFKGLF